jgi:hypothetical protein
MRSFGLLTAALFVLALGVPSAATPPQGFWTGQGHAVRTADLNLVQIKTEYASDFWFVATSDAVAGTTISGEATVSYNLTFSDDKLRTLIGYGHMASNFAVAQIPGISSLFSTTWATRDLLGMRMSYREFAPVRHGPITGSISGGQIRLRWTQPPEPIVYQEYAVHALNDQPTKTGTHPAYSPWIGDAAIIEPAPGHLFAATASEASRFHKDEVTISAIWSATQQR